MQLGQRWRSKVRLPRLEETVDGWEMTATVENEQPLLVFWEAGGQVDLEPSCSCGAFWCSHAAALLLRAAKERDLNRWQRQLSAAIAAAISPPADTKLTSTSSASGLEVIAPAPSFHLHLRKAQPPKMVKMILQSLGEKNPEQWIFAEASVSYGDHCGALRAASPSWTERVQTNVGEVELHHDAAAETAAAQQLLDTGLSSLKSNPAWRFLAQMRSNETALTGGDDLWFPDPSRVPIDHFWHQFRGEMVDQLINSGWQVTIDEAIGHRVHQANPNDWTTQLGPMDGGWFSFSVGFDIDGERHDLLPILANLLEADFLEETLDRPSHGFIYAPLPNGDALRLPIGRVRKILRHLAALIDPKFTGKPRVHALDAAGLMALDELGIDPPPEVAELASRLAEFSKIEETPVPEGLNATLRDYQLAGFRWMQFLARHGLHGILADDMGLGKTVQTIAHLLTEKQSGRSKGLPSLVVSPTSVVPNWHAEIARFAPDLRVLVLNGPNRSGYFRSIPYADVVLTSFALLQRDIEKLQQHTFHLAVLDEAQNIKNPRAKVAQAACKLVANHRLCLSGTPIENHLGELWSLMRFLIPGYLGSEKTFQDRFRKPIENDGNAEANESLKSRIAPLLLRRTKDQVAKELPPKTELIHYVELNTGQKDLYETVRATMDKRVRQAMAARGVEGFQIVFLDALLKLRQICCHPKLLPAEFKGGHTPSAKLDYLVELLDVLLEEGRRILIFSQFTTMLDLIAAHLERAKVRYLMLTGASKNRGELVSQFQTGQVPLFLISLKAGGTGLNLTAADTVIHYDPWWNPAAENQATDRAYRIGQDKPVFVHKLLCQETVEQRIHQLQQDKSKLATGLLAEGDLAQRLSPDMVRKLLEP